MAKELRRIILTTEPFLLSMPSFFFSDLILRYSVPKAKLQSYHFFILGTFGIMGTLMTYHFYLVYNYINNYLE